jgi:polyisoprenyl-phosphate glycosyltransferase
MYSVVVPVYNSASSLAELHARISQTFKELNLPFELILVEDGSRDKSWEVMESLQAVDRRVKIIRLTKNYGQHNALICGFSFSKGDFVLTLDDDLQNPPEEIPKLIRAIDSSGQDVVFGVPLHRAHSPVRNTGSSAYFRLLAKVLGKNADFRLSNFRIIKRHLIDHILRVSSPNPIVGLLLLNVTDRVGSVAVEHHPRRYGRTTYSGAKLVKLFMHGILYNSYLPLKLVWYLGVGCLVLSGGLGIYYLVRYFTGAISVSGFTTVVLLILFFSGIHMFALGIVGEYLLRILQIVRQFPPYTIREMRFAEDPCEKSP